MTLIIDTDEDIRKALAMRHIAVIGFSEKPARASHYVSVYMANAGYRVIGVNPLIYLRNDLPISVVETLSDVPPPIDIVNVFRKSDEIPEIAEAAIKRGGVKVLWLQEGIEHAAAAKMAREAGLLVIENRCLLKEHAREERRKESEL